MSLHYSEYNPSNENKENTRVKKGVTRKRRCKLEATKIKNLLNSFEGLENESSNLADFNPPPKPELTKIKNQSSDTPKTDTSKAEQKPIIDDQSDNSVQPHDYSTLNNDIANILDNISKGAPDLKEAIKNLNNITQSFDSTSKNINQIIENIEKKNNTLGKLIYEDSLYTNINGVALDLRALIQDVKDNPTKYMKAYFQGKK